MNITFDTETRSAFFLYFRVLILCRYDSDILRVLVLPRLGDRTFVANLPPQVISNANQLKVGRFPPMKCYIDKPH